MAASGPINHTRTHWHVMHTHKVTGTSNFPSTLSEALYLVYNVIFHDTVERWQTVVLLQQLYIDTLLSRLPAPFSPHHHQAPLHSRYQSPSQSLSSAS